VPELHDKIQAAGWVGKRRWTLWLQGDLKVMLPAEQPELALKQLAKWHAESDLFARALSQIDLRVNGMAYLRAMPKSEIAPEGRGRLLTAAASEAI
jgi:cell division protein FtsQ